MHLATVTHQNEIVELLFHCDGVDLAITNKEGFTPMDICGHSTAEQVLIIYN